MQRNAENNFFKFASRKTKKLLEICKKEFEEKPIFEASVSDIVNALGIARGSFYQYFENLEECFFTILSYENMDVHALFQESLQESGNNFFNALLRYAGILSKELIEYTKAIVHNLISRLFIENWGQKTFIEHFERQILWMKNGLKSRRQSGFTLY